METSFALLAICKGNSPVTGEFPSQRPVTQSFDVFFDLDAGDFRRHRAYYGITVMITSTMLLKAVPYVFGKKQLVLRKWNPGVGFLSCWACL